MCPPSTSGFFTSFMNQQLLGRGMSCSPPASPAAGAHPHPLHPSKAPRSHQSHYLAGGSSCPTLGCLRGGFYSSLCSSFLLPPSSFRVSAVNYICLSARAANLLSPSRKRGGQKTKVTPSHCASCHLQSRLVSLTNSWLNTTS